MQALVLCVCASVLAVPARAQCPDGSPPPCARGAARAVPPNSVAVLYFDNRTRDSADLYLADGLTEEIISRLSSIERLTVRSRHVVRRYRGTAIEDPVAVARALNVAYLVTGSVTRAGERVRVSAELVRAAGGVQVWGRPFDQAGSDVLAIQEHVARDVATGIVGRLLPAERGTIAARTTRDPVAWDHFLRGNHLVATRQPAQMVRAIREYEAAAAADPAFTDAVARIGYTYAIIVDNEVDVGLVRDTLVARAVRSAERAVRMDSMSSEAWLALAYVREAQHPRTLDGALGAFRRAIALNPASAEAHHQYADYHARTLAWDSSAAENQLALRLEPGRLATFFQLMLHGLARGRPADGLAWSDTILAVDPAFRGMALFRFMFYAVLDDTAAARRTLGSFAADPSIAGGAPFLAGYLDARRGDPAAMVQFRAAALRPTSATVPGNSLANGMLALLLMRGGDRDGVIQVLEAATPRGANLRVWMSLPYFDSIRTDPRFQRLWTGSAPF